MKLVISALAVGLLLGAAGAQAQSLNVGPNGITVDPRTQRERGIDRDMRREDRARERDRYERRRDYRAERRSDDCRTVTETRDTPRGQVRRTTRVCD